MFITVFFTMLLMNFLFMFAGHPLFMGLMLLTQTICIAVFSGMMLPSFWYSYILVLVFLGGMLILFIYVAAMASNEKIKQPFWGPLMASLFVGLSLLVLSSKLMIFTKSTSALKDESFMWIYTSPLMNLSAFLIIFLFLVLVAIVKITKWWGGSIRPLD